MAAYSGAFYHTLSNCIANEAKSELIFSHADILGLNIPEEKRAGKAYRLEIFNLCLTHELPSLSLSVPPQIKDFESEYVKWFKRNEALQGKEVCECQVLIDRGIYGKYQLLNHGEEWKQLISEDFNELKIQIGSTQSLYLMALSPKNWGNDYIQLMGNYKLSEDIEKVSKITLKAELIKLNSRQYVKFPVEILGYYSINIKNESLDPVKVCLEEYLYDSNIFYLKAGEAFCLDKEYRMNVIISAIGTVANQEQLVSFIYGV